MTPLLLCPYGSAFTAVDNMKSKAVNLFTSCLWHKAKYFIIVEHTENVGQADKWENNTVDGVKTDLFI